MKYTSIKKEFVAGYGNIKMDLNGHTCLKAWQKKKM